MNYNEVLAAAKDCVGPYCKACPVCNGRACANTMPGPGCKFPGNVAARNYDKWQEICVNMDTLCPNFADPDVSFEMFGHTFSAPIFAAPLGAVDMHYGPKYKDQQYNAILMKAAADYGVMAFTGDGVDPDVMISAVRDSKELAGMSVPTIKPWNKEAVFEKLDTVNASGIFAAAMDVDGAGLPFSEEEASLVLGEGEIEILIHLHMGQESAQAYGCDLTYDYVKINGDYRT